VSSPGAIPGVLINPAERWETRCFTVLVRKRELFRLWHSLCTPPFCSGFLCSFSLFPRGRRVYSEGEIGPLPTCPPLGFWHSVTFWYLIPELFIGARNVRNVQLWGIRRPCVGVMSNSETGDDGGEVLPTVKREYTPTVKREVTRECPQSRYRKQCCTRTSGIIQQWNGNRERGIHSA